MRFECVRASRFPRWPAAVVCCGVLWLVLAGSIELLGRRAGPKPVICPLKRLTGLPCPTCGTTRSALSLMMGEVSDAVCYNPLMFATGLMVLAVLLVRAASGRHVRIHVSRGERLTGWVAVGLLVTANWAYVICRGN